MTAALARRPHSIKLGKSMKVKLFLGPTNDKVQDAVVRPLMVDGDIREFTIGEAHDVTDDTFVIQRAFRMNDALPGDLKDVAKYKWKWEKDNWLLVNRDSGRVSRLNLPLFDPFYSEVAWYQDYAAYCGLSSDADMLYAVIFRVGGKNAVLDRELRRAKGGALPDSECAPPEWARQPMRVTFTPTGMQKMTFEVKGQYADPYAPAEAASPTDPVKEVTPN